MALDIYTAMTTADSSAVQEQSQEGERALVSPRVREFSAEELHAWAEQAEAIIGRRIGFIPEAPLSDNAVFLYLFSRSVATGYATSVPIMQVFADPEPMRSLFRDTSMTTDTVIEALTCYSFLSRNDFPELFSKEIKRARMFRRVAAAVAFVVFVLDYLIFGSLIFTYLYQKIEVLFSPDFAPITYYIIILFLVSLLACWMCVASHIEAYANLLVFSLTLKSINLGACWRNRHIFYRDNGFAWFAVVGVLLFIVSYLMSIYLFLSLYPVPPDHVFFLWLATLTITAALLSQSILVASDSVRQKSRDKAAALIRLWREPNDS